MNRRSFLRFLGIAPIAAPAAIAAAAPSNLTIDQIRLRLITDYFQPRPDDIARPGAFLESLQRTGKLRQISVAYVNPRDCRLLETRRFAEALEKQQRAIEANLQSNRSAT